MTFEATIADLNVFCQHENNQIREFAVKAIEYSRALQNGECSQAEYDELMGDLDSLKGMARTADEETQVVQIFECVRLIPSLI
jgi:hypothetical protein